jgi:hypothetical protein
MKDMYNKGGETADDKRYRMRMQKQVGGVAEEMSDVDKFIQLNAELEAAKQQYKGNPEALKNVARHRADIENSFSPETRAEAYQRMDAETEERDGKMEGGEVDGREGYANAGVTSIVNYFIKSKEGKKIIKDLVKGVNKPLKADARSAKVLTDNYDSVDLQRMAEALATTVQANTKYSADGVASLITNKSNIVNEAAKQANIGISGTSLKAINSNDLKTMLNLDNARAGGGDSEGILNTIVKFKRALTENPSLMSRYTPAATTTGKGKKAVGQGTGAGIVAGAGGVLLFSDEDKTKEPVEASMPEEIEKDAKTLEAENFDIRFSEEMKNAEKGKTSYMYKPLDPEAPEREIALELKAGDTKLVPQNKGGMMKYAEGSMLMPPEMGMEDEMPEDTYDNIPEDEKAAVEASQLPDSEMEEDYTGYVLGQSLDTEEQEYLMGILETDERLSGIFDKVMDVAGEFSGEGSVEGPGTGTSDSIPARLSDGEFVFTKKATDQMGADQLQTMMDEAEKAYDGGYMKKAFGGLTSEDDIEMDSYDSEEEVKKQMIAANQMPSIR